jgi:conjugative transfer region protein TrbK
MTKRSQFRRLSIVAGVGTIIFVVTACTIQLRDPEQFSSASPTTEHAEPLAAEFARCRTVTLEQRDALVGCRRIWAEQRRQFLRQKSTPASAGLPNDAAPNTRLPPQERRKDERRAPQGWPLVPTWQGE